MACIELLGNISLEFGLQVFKKNLESVFMGYLTNTAAAVREQGVEMVRYLAEKFKE